MKRKTLSLTLALCLVFSLFSWCGILSVAEEIIPPDNNEIIQTAEPDEEAIPYLRLYEEEPDLFTVAYLNTDGTVTKTFYPYPVKYTDKDGKIKDISLDIKETKDGYATKENSVITEFGNNLSDGIVLSAEDVCIEMTPINESRSVFLSSDKRSLTYAVGDKLSYVYSLTYLGFKEDILVEEYNGQTEYGFTLKTNGLALTEENGSYFLKDSENETKAAIGDIIVFTADGKNNTLGRLEAETVKANEEYVITIILNDEYLKDVKTTYPIRIDPTIEISYTNNGSGAIEDVTINSLAGSDGTSGSGVIGKRANYGVSRLLMRFPGLNFSSVIPADATITNGFLYIYDVMQESAEMTVNCHIFTGNTWTESTATWANVNPNSYVSTVMSSNTVSDDYGEDLDPEHWYSFKIKSALVGWYNGTYDQNKGIILKATSSVEGGGTNICKTFATYNRSTCKPYFTVLYTMPLAHIVEDYITVGVDETRQLYASEYQIEHSNFFTWTSSDTSVATVDEYGNVTGIAPGTATINMSFTTVSHMEYDSCVVEVIPIAEGMYFIKNKGTAKYIDVYHQLMCENTCVCQWDLYNANSQRWIITYLGNEYYSIESANSYIPFYLGISNDSNENEVSAILRSGNLTNGMKWKISQTSSGAYKLTAKCGEASNRVLAVEQHITNNNGIYLNQINYIEDTNYNDEWFFCQSQDKAIIIVPGITCSSLQNGNGTKVWLFWGLQSNIACDDNGLSLYDIYPYNPDNYGVLDIYSNIYNTLSSSYGNDYDIIFFAYDWRMSCADAAQNLEILTDYYDSCIMIAHSMGGIVVSSYLSKNQNNRDKIEKFISVGTPFTGAPKALYVIETGRLTSSSQLLLDLAAYAKNIPAIYELLPTQRYFQRYLHYINIDDIYLGGYNNSWNYMKTLHWALKNNGSPKIMFNEAQDFHDSLIINGIHVSERSDVDTYKIVGIGEDTINDIFYDENNEFDYCGYVNGDGTVPLYSALNNTDAYSYKTYAFFKNHVDLIKYDGVIQLISDIIDEEPYVYYETASANSQGLTQSINTELFNSNYLLSNDKITIVTKGVSHLNICTDNNYSVYTEGEQLYFDDDLDIKHRCGSVWEIGNYSCQYVLYNNNYIIYDVETVSDNPSLRLDYCNYGLSDNCVKIDLTNMNGAIIRLQKKINEKTIKEGYSIDYTVTKSD